MPGFELGLSMEPVMDQKLEVKQIMVKECPHCGARLKPLDLNGLRTESKISIFCPFCKKKVYPDESQEFPY